MQPMRRRAAANDRDPTRRAGASAFPAGRARRRLLAALTSALALSLAACAVASAAAQPPSLSAHRVHRLCGSPRPGAAECTGMKLLSDSLTPSELHADAVRQAGEARAGAQPAVTYEKPVAGYLTPQSLHAAYSLPSESSATAVQTIAVVDAFDDPTAEADLGVYDSQFGLPACTSANGCFRKIDEQGKTSPLPALEGEWAGEISIDVQMAHAICQNCHILLVEAESESFADLGSAVNAAVAAGADEISNSYAGPEEPAYTALNTSYYDHPGVLVAAASGDCGYLNEACGAGGAANFPADSPDVLAVGGTKLTASKGTWKSTVWSEGGSGCSTIFSAPAWQSSLSEFPATGCGGQRAIADVAAIGDPNTGVDVYDSTPEGNGDPTGWGVWGGTSVASPILAAEFALAGGTHGVRFPAATLYSHAGEGEALYDVSSGANGSCAGASICQAAVGYDGPSGVGSPTGLRAFASPGSPSDVSPPKLAGTAEEGQTLSVTDGSWSNEPTSIADAWQDCNASGSACSSIAGASGQSYTPTPAELGTTIRVRETATNADGVSAPSFSAPSAPIGSNKPTISGFAPAGAITGSWVTIDGTGLATTSEVLFGTLPASTRALSATQIEARVPDGARPGKIALTTAAGTAKSAAKFSPTLSIVSFSPSGGAPGTLVKIKGVGFDSGSSVSFDGVPAARVSYLSATKLDAVVPAGAGSGAIVVTNTAAPAGSVSSAGSYLP